MNEIQIAASIILYSTIQYPPVTLLLCLTGFYSLTSTQVAFLHTRIVIIMGSGQNIEYCEMFLSHTKYGGG